MTTTAKGIPELSTSAFIKNGPTDINAALAAVDALLDTRSKCVVATEEAFTPGASYAVATTPDRVSSLVVPTDGVLEICYSALWKSSLGGQTAAVFIGSNQLKAMNDAGAPAVQEVGIGGTDYGWLYSSPASGGLTITTNASGDGSVVTTGMSRGQPVRVDVTAGTYTIEVRFKGAASMSVKERKLHVRMLPF